MDKETLIKIAEELHHGAFDANADYLILQQYRKNQREYAEEMKMSPAFYQTIHGALMKACFMEIAKLYDSSNGVVIPRRSNSHPDLQGFIKDSGKLP